MSNNNSYISPLYYHNYLCGPYLEYRNTADKLLLVFY